MRARRRVAELDHLDSARCQDRTLRGIVHRAAATPFGQAHDFARIRTWDDYRRLVPVCTAAEIAQGNGIAKPRDMLASNRKSLHSALALLAVRRPSLRVFDGPLLVAGAAADLPPRTSLLERIAYRNLPDLLPGTVARWVRASPTCLIGTSQGLRAFANVVRTLDDRYVLPPLAVLCRLRRPGDDDDLRIGSPVITLNLLYHPGGLLAVEDPRYQQLRLLPDAGLFFEFIPVDESGRTEPTRHRLSEAVPGVDYELTVSSSAGYWSCRTGFRVCFESTDPPLFRTLPVEIVAPTPAPPPPRSQPQRIQAPHARPVPAVPSTLWSVGVF